MSNTKVKVIAAFKHPIMNEILPVDFETELQPILSTIDKVVCNELTRFNSITKKHEVIFPKQIQPSGSYEGFRFKGANGQTYTNKIIEQMIGFKPISEVFKPL